MGTRFLAHENSATDPTRSFTALPSSHSNRRYPILACALSPIRCLDRYIIGTRLTLWHNIDRGFISWGGLAHLLRRPRAAPRGRAGWTHRRRRSDAIRLA